MSQEFKDFMKPSETGGKVFADTSEEFTSMVLEYKNNPSDELHTSIVLLWQKMTKYKSGCVVCFNQRRSMIQGLNAIKHGNAKFGYLKIKSSIKSVPLKNKLAEFFGLDK